MKGYKVFNPDWTCKGFKYEVGKKYHCDGKISCCKNGFHFCTKLADCFNYYNFNSNNKVAEIEASGDIDSKEDDTKHYASDIEIIREITWHEVLDMINEGKDNTGMCNTGDRNTGNCNTGDWNTGNHNTGNCNTGNYNTGNYNTGNHNTGDWNTGNHNTGNCNTGDCNTGDWNTGDCNTGDCNTGDWNTGDCNTGNCNTGDCNTGDYNTGNCNTGNCNTGDCNTGDWNTGNHNTGDGNKTNNNTGCFMTEERTIEMFNQPSGMTYADWERSKARNILFYMPQNIVNIVWTSAENMSDTEKEAHPEFKTIGGYLHEEIEKADVQSWWDGLSSNDKETVMSIPNFDADIFFECTGIRV